MTADRMVMAASAPIAPRKTCTRACGCQIAEARLERMRKPSVKGRIPTHRLGFFMAMMAAMKKVLSPISDSRIMPQDLMKPCTMHTLQHVRQQQVIRNQHVTL